MSIATNHTLGIRVLKALGLDRQTVTSLVIVFSGENVLPSVNVTTLVHDEQTKELVEALAQFVLVPRDEIGGPA